MMKEQIPKVFEKVGQFYGFLLIVGPRVILVVLALVHLYYFFSPPDYYLAVYGGDSSVARSVSFFAVIIFVGASEYYRVWIARKYVP